jgi:hypothetical protein
MEGYQVGEKLLADVASATGLPEDLVTVELNRLVAKAGKKPEDMTLEDLRLILAEYVQDVLLAAHREFSDTEN